MLRAIIAFLILPGVVAGLVPSLLTLLPERAAPQSWLFVMVLAAGLLILIQSVVSFYRRGHGTLAPWDPPQRLVVADLYRFNRNPMYVGVVLLLFGWAGVLGSAWHYGYAVVMWLVFHLRVLYYEEPEMQQLFPGDWPQYKANVPRWRIRLNAYECRNPSEEPSR